MARPERVKTFQFRRELARMIAGVKTRPVEVLAHGQPVAVLISVEQYERYQAMATVYTNVGIRSSLT